MKTLPITAAITLLAVGALGYKIKELDGKLASVTSNRSLGVLNPNAQHKIQVADANGEMKECVVSFTQDRRVIVAIDETSTAYLQLTYAAPNEKWFSGKETPVTATRYYLHPDHTVAEAELPKTPHGTIRFSLHDSRTEVEMVTFEVNENLTFSPLEKS